MAPRRYIGITDFTNRMQTDLMASTLLQQTGNKTNKITLHAGVMMSRKTLNDLETKWSDVFPEKDQVSRIFHHGWMVNCLHYADYDSVDVEQNLIRAISYGGSMLNALQLDMIWPNPDELCNALLHCQQELDVILQINSEAMGMYGNDPKRVMQQIAEYDGLITHVLLDKSMGRGQGMDAQALMPYADEIATQRPDLGLVAAGGLGPYTTHLVKPLLKQHPKLSVDAQGQLRSSGSALNPIEWERAYKYVHEMLALMKI